MKKIIALTIFIGILLTVYFFRNNSFNNVSAAVSVGENNSYLGLIKQGWNITCLSSSPTAEFDTNHVPGSHTVQINLGGECRAKNGCYLVVCQGPNEQYYEDQGRLAECDEHDGSESLVGSDKENWGDENNKSTWGDWCAHVEEQMGETFESAQGCRSGVPELDAILPNSNDETIPTVASDYNLAPGPIGTVITLNNAYDHIPYQFYAFGQGGQEALLGAGRAEGSDRSQQQGQINRFEIDSESNISKCVTITWDPYGRVFDSQSLEPIPNIKINLLNESKKPVSQITKNYDVTATNGVFNIQVEKQGSYYMSVNSSLTHEFISNPKLNQNYKYIYSDLYYPDISFFEKVGVPTHHDIPLNPLGAPFHSDIVIYPQSLNQMDMGSNIKFEGKISNPLAQVCLMGETSKKQYACSQADKIGQFQIFINKSKYPSEALLIKTNKVNPSDISQFISQSVRLESLLTPILLANNKNTSSKFEPLIRYLEGYIYNDQGEILPNAEVSIKLKADDKIVGKLTSDEKGNIKILSSQLPLFDYYLEVISNDKSIKINTSKFIDQNKTYFEEVSINPMIDRKPDGTEKEFINSSVVETPNNQIKQNTKNIFNKTNNPQIKAEIFILIFIVTLLILITIGVLIYIKKNSSIDKIK